MIIGVLVHDIAEQKQTHQIQGAHKGKVSGLCFADHDRVLSCGVDCNVKLWDVSPQEQNSVRLLVPFVLFHPADGQPSNKNRSACSPGSHLSSMCFPQQRGSPHLCNYIALSITTDQMPYSPLHQIQYRYGTRPSRYRLLCPVCLLLITFFQECCHFQPHVPHSY